MRNNSAMIFLQTEGDEVLDNTCPYVEQRDKRICQFSGKVCGLLKPFFGANSAARKCDLRVCPSFEGQMEVIFSGTDDMISE